MKSESDSNADGGAGAAGSAGGAWDAVRVGHGYDLHRLEPRPPAGKGRALVIGGEVFEHDRGPVAHSDGDVLYHAVVDALMGALGKPDIGQMFPDNAAENEGRDSAEFVGEAARIVREAGWRVVNVDATVILERPRLSGSKERMRGNVARLLGVEPARVNVKGKSHEKVDAVGEGRAVEAHVVVLMARG
ncbi:MAG: 2-C-methyl-D-erythritol 2,4-cyclodiphosphate synthase [Phycisphaeraceae bacterium]|nr:2-C-methyl-D-erythritol 2,4-cyclodiphosphate synthase [Phycisphaeraceae bacterium]